MEQFIVLETQTTGLGADAEIIEIVLINQSGVVRLHQRIKPTVKIEPAATDMHKIRDSDLVDSPSWFRVHDSVLGILDNAAVIVGYNISFDIDKISNMFHWGLLTPADRDRWVRINKKTHCVMREYAYTHNDGCYARLRTAAKDLGIPRSEVIHTDAVMKAEVVRKMHLIMS